MSADNQQERPNYRLHYKAECRDDYSHLARPFMASDDEDARKKAYSFIEEANNGDRERIKKGEQSSQDWCRLKPLKLERIAYVQKIVEEMTPIPLEGDVISQVRMGAPVELTALAYL